MLHPSEQADVACWFGKVDGPPRECHQDLSFANNVERGGIQRMKAKNLCVPARPEAEPSVPLLPLAEYH
jgi:hypothetical protein